ncbi:MAG: hypothetical protein ACU837_08710 [Gammaproteobacteria bacterium]
MNNGARSQGFILAMTLWMLAAVVVAAGFIVQWIAQSKEEAWQLKQDLQYELYEESTKEGLQYLLATQYFSVGGLITTPATYDAIGGEKSNKKSAFSKNTGPYSNTDNNPAYYQGNEIALDDRPYNGFGNVDFSLQDEAGLVGLNFADDSILVKLLNSFGVPPDKSPALVAKLQDYIDPDDLYRINGAEKNNYASAGLAPPANHALVATQELLHVLDWKQYEPLFEKKGFFRAVTVAMAGAPNLNNAPASTLKLVPWISQDIVDKIIAARRNRALMGTTEIENVIGSIIASLDPETVRVFPSRYIRLTLRRPGKRQIREIHLQLTPLQNASAPWEIDSDTLGTLPEPLTTSPTDSDPIQTPFFFRTNNPEH